MQGIIYNDRLIFCQVNTTTPPQTPNNKINADVKIMNKQICGRNWSPK